MIEQMRRQVRERLNDEAGIEASADDVAPWTEDELKAATLWLDALLRRKSGVFRGSEVYEFPPHVYRIVKREAAAVDASTHLA